MENTAITRHPDKEGGRGALVRSLGPWNGTGFLKTRQKEDSTVAIIDFGGTKEEVVMRNEFPMARARKVLKDETIAVIGYGVQGPAQALNTVSYTHLTLPTNR